MAQSKLTIDELKSVCDYHDGVYVQKQGEEYIEALSKLFHLKNKNDRPFTIEDVKKEPLLNDFKFLGVSAYQYICDLQANPLTINQYNKKKNEKIMAKNFSSLEAQNIFNNALGLSYIITCVVDNQEHIVKIGSSRKTFKERLLSYNCGTIYNWRTASTTNIKILQSMVTTRALFKLYIYDCSEEVYTIEWCGVKSVQFASPKSLAIEDIMIKQFMIQFNKKPLANIQADAEG